MDYSFCMNSQDTKHDTAPADRPKSTVLEIQDVVMPAELIFFRRRENPTKMTEIPEVKAHG